MKLHNLQHFTDKTKSLGGQLVWSGLTAAPGHLPQAHLNWHSWLVAQGCCTATPKVGKIGTHKYPLYTHLSLQSAPGLLTLKWLSAVRIAASRVGVLWGWGVRRTSQSIASWGGLIPATKGVLLKWPSGHSQSVLFCILLLLFSYQG